MRDALHGRTSGAGEGDRGLPVGPMIRVLLFLSLLFMTGWVSVWAQEAPESGEGELTKLVETGFEYTDYSGDLPHGDVEFVGFMLTKPYVYQWRVDAGHASRFDDDAFDIGTSYTRYLRRVYHVSAGLSTGTGDVISPEYRFDIGAGGAFLEKDNLLGSVGYIHTQSKAENSSDGFAFGLTYYAAPHWILGASALIDIGHPGNTTSTSGGLGITWYEYQSTYIGAAIEFGDVSYMLVGEGEVLVDYQSTTYKLYFTRYFSPDKGINLRLDYADNEYYRTKGFAVSGFKEW